MKQPPLKATKKKFSISGGGVSHSRRVRSRSSQVSLLSGLSASSGMAPAASMPSKMSARSSGRSRSNVSACCAGLASRLRVAVQVRNSIAWFLNGLLALPVDESANQRMKLTGAAILVSRDTMFSRAARQVNAVVPPTLRVGGTCRGYAVVPYAKRVRNHRLL